MQDTTQSMQKKGHSLEEISKDRGTAQQNSMDAILAAEERYQKSKDMDGSVGQNEEKSSVQKVKEYTTQFAAQTAAEKAAKAKDY
ncbi:hypothetical protein Tco_0402396 [Tanacetum coccineum]